MQTMGHQHRRDLVVAPRRPRNLLRSGRPVSRVPFVSQDRRERQRARIADADLEFGCRGLGREEAGVAHLPRDEGSDFAGEGRLGSSVNSPA